MLTVIANINEQIDIVKLIVEAINALLLLFIKQSSLMPILGL